VGSLHVELLVVLAPAFACVVLCLVARGGLSALLAAKVIEPPLRALASRQHVNTLLAVATNLMFVGSAVGVLYGSSERRRLTSGWDCSSASVFAWAVVRLSRQAAALARNEAEERNQAMLDALRNALSADRNAAPSIQREHRGRRLTTAKTGRRCPALWKVRRTPKMQGHVRMEQHLMDSISGYTVFAVIAIIAGLWLVRMVGIATDREEAKRKNRH
jgi:hypothetical protein